jgi:hypothetical protein
MAFIVVRKAANAKERDEVYNVMFDGEPKTTLTCGKRAARFDESTAQLVAKQLNGLFPGHVWRVMTETEFAGTR